ncbi:hypothetical protein [Nocardioides caricicola]|uniref:Uncharacterized protein n=1 Tax=Nocardioides caricicola TaxID=634770 RepID=A0ABW0MTC3_9ACTN
MEDVVFLAVIGGRFLVPLLIPRFPLPAIIGCLVLDAADQTIFQAFGYDPPGYQSYDKAMDVFYLAIAYLATMRNWQNLAAYSVGRFLYFYRLAGVFLFEMTGARAVLLIFPNTFEYFFIAYEAIRTRWAVLARTLTWWVVLAGIIWVFVKLPQEYWLHVAKLDVTDTLEEYWWAWPLLIAVVLGAAALLWFVAIPRLGPIEHGWRFTSDPMPASVATVASQATRRVEAGGFVWSWVTFEKVFLVGLISVIYSQTLPGITASNTELFVYVATFVVLNAAITLLVSRREWTIESAGLAVLARIAVNVALVTVTYFFFDERSVGWDTLFFLSLISLITTLHDRYQPALAYRQRERAGL